jgi:4'-phosphopantetheinyl transferase
LITVWLARFSDITHQFPCYTALLSADEQARAARYLDDGVRQRFILARGMLRQILGHALNLQPQEIVFEYGKRGKPFLPDSGLQFNLSHAEDRLLLAVAENQVIGADIEYIRPMTEMYTVARMNFSTQEQAAFFALPESQQRYAFYTGWTRKEAYIKAMGDGFALPLKDFDVTLAPDEPAKLVYAKGDDANRWELIHLEPAADYVAALCVPSPAQPVELRDFIEDV